MEGPSIGCLWTLGVISAVVGAIFLFDVLVPSRAVRDLPAGATEVREYYKDFGMTGDFTRLIKARMPEDTCGLTMRCSEPSLCALFVIQALARRVAGL